MLIYAPISEKKIRSFIVQAVCSFCIQNGLINKDSLVRITESLKDLVIEA